MQFISHFTIRGCLKGFYPFLLVTPSPLSPSPWQGEGELIERGASPLLDTPLIKGSLKGRNKIQGVLEGRSPSYIITSPSPLKERGIKGVRYINRQDILLREYEVCQQANDSIGRQVWLSTSVFLSTNVGLLGWIAYGITTRGAPHPDNIHWLVLGLGLGIISIFIFWIHWLNRMQFLTRMNYERMREIEIDLGMWKNWFARALDKWGKLSKEKWEKLPKDWQKLTKEEYEGLPQEWKQLHDEERKKLSQGKERLIKLHNSYPHLPRWKWWKFLDPSPKYAPPRGFEGLRWIAVIVVIIWVVFIIMAFKF